MSLKIWSHADAPLKNIEPLSGRLEVELDSPVENSRLEPKRRDENGRDQYAVLKI
jgi:hypothetical protein